MISSRENGGRLQADQADARCDDGRLRIILSRKGFDSAAGGCPSPIIDGRPVSMPIPSPRMPTATRFGDLSGPYGRLVTDLTRGRLTASDWCHLDPDIAESALPRRSGWRGAFGQIGAAQGHLAGQNIQPGDLFVFWGLFRPAELDRGRWRYVGAAEHRIWGWLQIGEIIRLGSNGEHVLEHRPWLRDHPHARAGWGASNTIYIAAERLALGSPGTALPGFGTLPTGFRLSQPGKGLCCWRAPDWLNPRLGGSGMTYHAARCWDDRGTLRAAAQGQEFVAAVERDGEAVEWLTALLGETRRRARMQAAI